jgi:hypothetical protein
MGPAILTLLEDTRNQIGKHKNIASYCERNGIRIVRVRLLVGDYMLAGSGGGGISVDTKASVAEIAQNCFQDHERFRAECKQAQDCGIRLIVLIEEMPPEGDLDKWVSPLDRNGEKKYLFDPSTLKKVMATMTERYGVQFRFCDGRSTGRLLIEYLKGERT